MAGLAAARRLTGAGRRVMLVEARDRIGGRVYTVRPPGSATPIELGAEFIHGHSNALWPVIREAGLPTRPVPERHVGARDGQQVSFPDVRTVMERVVDDDPEAPDRPLVEAIERRRAAGDAPALLDAGAAYVESFHAADVRRLGVRALAETEAAEDEDGEEVSRLTDGYDGVPLWLHAQCPRELLELRLSTCLLALRWRAGEVTAVVRHPDHTTGELRARCAVVTLPIGVLRAPAGTPGAVVIDPDPPGWRKALRAIETGPAIRLVLRFDTAWWDRIGEPPISFVHTPGSVFPVWWVASPGEEPHITAWRGGPRAESLAEVAPDELLRLALMSLEDAFGELAIGSTSRLRGLHYHNWITDPFSLGAYSYGGVGAAAARERLVHPVASTLYLAGEAFDLSGRSATVHGALTSGIHAAEKILSA